jgi:ribonuclease HI
MPAVRQAVRALSARIVTRHVKLLVPAVPRVMRPDLVHTGVYHTSVYTDASIARGRGGIGFAAREGDDEWDARYSARVPHALAPRDINRLELLAMYVALTMLDPRRDLVIHTDSQTALDQLVTRRRNRKYGGLTRATLELILSRPGWTLLAKVKGHSGDEGNDMADRLAGMATSGATHVTWPM